MSIQHPQQITPTAVSIPSSPGAAAKLTSAAKEFESILLNQWLQGAESSFGSAPGGGDDDDADGEQMKGFATQQLATQMVASGGIGIAHLVQDGLTKAAITKAHANSQSIPAYSNEVTS